MGGAQVAPMVSAAEGEREDVVDRERVAESGGPAAEPAGRLLGQHPHTQALVLTTVAACARASTPTLGGLRVHGAARPASRSAALDAGT